MTNRSCASIQMNIAFGPIIAFGLNLVFGIDKVSSQSYTSTLFVLVFDFNCVPPFMGLTSY